MSFSSDAKAELCRAKIDKKCCAVAESYGVLLYCNTFSQSEIRIITASADFAARLPKLFRRAFSVGFDVQPDEEAGGKRSFLIRDGEKLKKIFDAFGAEWDGTLSHHVNFGVIEEECDRVSFLRGAFLAGGSVTDPEKRYHLELATPHHAVARESYSVLLEQGFTARETQRGGNHLLYFKPTRSPARSTATAPTPTRSSPPRRSRSTRSAASPRRSVSTRCPSRSRMRRCCASPTRRRALPTSRSSPSPR